MENAQKYAKLFQKNPHQNPLNIANLLERKFQACQALNPPPNAQESFCHDIKHNV